MSDLNSMGRRCKVGFGGSNEAIEVLWDYVYQLKTKVSSLEAEVSALRSEHRFTSRRMKAELERIKQEDDKKNYKMFEE